MNCVPKKTTSNVSLMWSGKISIQTQIKEYVAHIDIYGLNRTGLLNDVLQVLSNTTKNISTVNAQPTKDIEVC